MNIVVPNQVAHALAPAEKPGKFSGVDFKRWQHRYSIEYPTVRHKSFHMKNGKVENQT